MPFEPGNNANPAGRPKGSQNASTLDARRAIADFVESNTERLNGLLDGIEKEKGPQAAFEAIMSVCEYHIPKLARTENKTESNVTHKIVFGRETNNDA